jgi:hypothetical protein
MNITAITDTNALPKARQTSDALPIRKVLTENPGVWHAFTEVTGVTAAQIKGGITKAFQPKGAFDAYTVKGSILAVYVGEQGTDEQPVEVEEAPKPRRAPRKTKAQKDAEAAQAALDAEDAPEVTESAVATEEV